MHKTALLPSKHKRALGADLWLQPQVWLRRDRRDWWRWGRVELPVQSLQPETTTSVSDGLSSISRATIGSVPIDPSTFPCGLYDRLRGLTDRASPLNDASTARGEEAASTLTLRP
jgi:hypothetical protein